VGLVRQSMQQSLDKIIARHTRLPENARQRASRDLFVKWHHANFGVSSSRDMAASLPGLVKPNSLKRANDLAT
jgi:hypothetical protein